MSFLKENSKLISRLFVNQIGMTIFGIVLTMAVNLAADKNPVLVLLVSLFAVLFYLSLIYNVMWEEGSRNAIKIHAGRCEPVPYFSWKAALWASVPNLVLGVLMMLFYLLGYPLGLSFGGVAYGVLHVIAGLFEAMYVGTFSAILGLFSDLSLRYLVASLLYIFSSLPMILVSVGAYALGARNFYLFGKRKTKKK